jgi:hypothetical protein
MKQPTSKKSNLRAAAVPIGIAAMFFLAYVLKQIFFR